MTAADDTPRRDERTDGPSWIARLLEFDRDGDTFVVSGTASGPGTRVFGGLIAAQALRAAGETVEDDKHPHSLHVYFVRGGRYDVDVTLQVERTRTGRSFDTRRVRAVQDGDVILEMIASFHRPEPGADWHLGTEPTVALHDAVPRRPAIEFTDRFEIRTNPQDGSRFAVPPYWIRARDPIDDDPLMIACTLTLISDLGPVPAARPPGTPVTALESGTGFATSLDHSVWFHRPFRPQAWHRYEIHLANSSDCRGLVVGALYDESSTLIASITQEALWRL
jgi:acyl-CoA thioesterase II